jgi:hypothetical protein
MTRKKVRFQVLTAANMRVISLMMEAASTSEKPVNPYQITRRNIPEDSHIHRNRLYWTVYFSSRVDVK